MSGALCCGAAAAGCSATAAVDRYLLQTGRSAANPPQRRANDGMDSKHI